MRPIQYKAQYQPRSQNVDYADKIAGCVLGFAIGDALGSPLEFLVDSKRVDGYEPAYKKGLKRGQYTDDTQNLEIGLDAAIESRGEIDLKIHERKLVEWYTSGKARSIGRTTRLAINKIIAGEEKSGIDHISSCGTLALPRLIPYSLLSAVNRSKYKLERNDIRKILGVTHAHRKVLQMGELFNYFIQEIMHGRGIQGTVDLILFEDDFLNKKVRQKLSMMRDLSGSGMDSPIAIETIGPSGFVEEVVFSSLYAALKGNSFEEAVLISANGGGDSDSRAALTGALSGLQSGESQIPLKLKDSLERKEELEKKARQLFFLRR